MKNQLSQSLAPRFWWVWFWVLRRSIRSPFAPPSSPLPVRPPSIDVKHFNRPFRSPSIALDALAAPSRVVDVSPKSPSRASSRVLASAPLSRVVRTVAVVLVRLVVRGVVGRFRHRSTLARLRCALVKGGTRVSGRARRPDGTGRENPNPSARVMMCVRCSPRAIRLFEPRTRERWPPRTPRERSRTSPRRSSSSLWRNTSDPPARYAKNRTHDDARASRRDRATTRARERRGDGRTNATTSAVTNANVFVRIDRRRARRRAGVWASTKARDVGVESSARASPRASGAGAVRATARVASCGVDGRCVRTHLCDRVRGRRRACATSRDAGDRDVTIDRPGAEANPRERASVGAEVRAPS